MRIVKLWPRRYCHHLFTAVVIANNSLTYVEALSIFGLKALLKKAIGWPLCDKTASIPIAEASVSTVKGKLKSGNARTGAKVKACFRESKAVCVARDHWKGSMVVALTRGAAMAA